MESQSQRVIWGISANFSDDTSKHFKDKGKTSCWTSIGTQGGTTSNSRFWHMRTHSIQGQQKDKDSSCESSGHIWKLEHIFYTTLRLNSDFSSERQPNCETIQWQYENWTTSRGDHIRTTYQTKLRRQMWDLHIQKKLLQPHQLQSKDNSNH